MNRFLFTTALVLTLPFAANAATIMDDDAYGAALTDFATAGSFNPTGLPENAPVLELDMFDGSLGTLNSVQIMLMGGFTSEGDIVNMSPNPETAQADVEIDIYFTSDMFNLTTLNAGDDTGFDTYANGVNTGAVDLVAEGMETLNPADVNPFVGAAGDTFEISYSTLVAAGFIGGGGNLEFDITTMADVSAKVVYDYTEPVVVTPPVSAVPVPAALPLMLGALGIAGFVGRRRRG